jgi:hypothetical protein
MSSHSEEAPVNWSTLIRQTHRWVSMAFMLTVILNIVVMSVRPGPPPAWVTYSPLLPLFILMFSGLYLFALPYVTRWRRVRHPA